MTVAEYIEHLKRLPQDLPVFTASESYLDLADVPQVAEVGQVGGFSGNGPWAPWAENNRQKVVVL